MTEMKMKKFKRKIGKLPKLKKYARKFSKIEPKVPKSEFERDDMKAKPRKRR